MQIKNMSYIIALAEAGTLSGAGKQLGISQPTLSVFLSNLEQELGIDLSFAIKKSCFRLRQAGFIWKQPDAFLPHRSRLFSPSVSSPPLRPWRFVSVSPRCEVLRWPPRSSPVSLPGTRISVCGFRKATCRNCAIWCKMEWLPVLSAPALTRSRQILTISPSFGKRSLSQSRPSIRWRTAPKPPQWNSHRYHQRSCPTLPLSL